MTLSSNINTREFDKFEDVAGLTHVRTKGTGVYSPSGLRNSGRILEVEITSTEWRPLPTTALTDRNALCIQNQSNYDMLVQYVDTVGITYGVLISAGSERFYDTKDNIITYGRSVSGTFNVIVEELS